MRVEGWHVMLFLATLLAVAAVIVAVTLVVLWTVRRVRIAAANPPDSATAKPRSATGGPDCGVIAVGHGRRRVRLHDIPYFGRPVRLPWAKRVWRCPDQGCPRMTFAEEHALAGPRAKPTARAVNWATDALQHFDT
ncbi:transposase family protein [Arthrobacter sp. AL12]|uniref:transposase family protein n=1 Tax=Arthrobacter sp. AL12 TaxID=3042241 RepID=UPI00249B0B30|nr:transposase family protein [Arthrobacter sp. AL12]MDI3214095.1 hypothetical protein [Arthrobacter sp. AL12]